MTAANSPTITPKPATRSWFSNCVVTMFAIVFAILGVFELVYGSIAIYIFSSVRMHLLASIAALLVIACECFIYFVLAFRIKCQHWLISLALLAMVWLVLPMLWGFLINMTTMRVRVNGYSMASTLPSDSYVLADKQAYQQNDPERGDIVIFQSPLAPVALIKRVIGLPGDVVSISQGQVSINGVLTNEPYVSTKATYTGKWNVPQGDYFVLGDNRRDSGTCTCGVFYPEKILWPKQFGYTFL